MAAASARHLHVVDAEPGERLDGCPACTELEAKLRQAEKRVRGLDLRIANLQADRLEKCLGSPYRAQVEALHACWKAGTGRRRDLDFHDREAIELCIRKLGFVRCLEVLAAAAYDPYQRELKNGKRKRYTEIRTLFGKGTSAADDFAEHAPTGWQPNPERIAKLAGESEEKVREWLAVSENGSRVEKAEKQSAPASED